MRDFEKDIKELFEDRIKTDEKFCADLWSSLVNTDWVNEDGTKYDCSFRYAAALIAEIRERGSYTDWLFCEEHPNVSKEISDKMSVLGWTHD